jgi:hypothetical protein
MHTHTKEYVMENYKKLDMNLELYRHKFTEAEMTQFITEVSASDILQSQVLLSVDFVVDYILNPMYQGSDRDSWITIDEIVSQQPYIDKKLLSKCLVDKGYVLE